MQLIKLQKRENVNMLPHNMPMVIIGTAILWFGWFGFNGGSAVNGISVNTFVVTNTAAAAALGWVIVEWRIMANRHFLVQQVGL